MGVTDHFSDAVLDRFFPDRPQRRVFIGIAFALPYLLLFLVFLFYPLLKGLYMSLFNWDPLFPAQSEFIGLQNYQRLIGDPQFWNATLNTIYFVALTVPSILLVSLVTALGLNQGIKGSRLLRFLYFSPYVLTVSVVAIVWMQLYGQNGLILTITGLTESPLAIVDIAMPAIALPTVWWQTGFYFAIILAARQTVPDQLYEAAKLDGAGPFRMFKDITVPQIKNALLFVTIASTINQFQVFGQPFIMTQGGPLGQTETIVFYLYSLGFRAREFGFAAAVGYTLLIILVGVSLLNYYIIGTAE